MCCHTHEITDVAAAVEQDTARGEQNEELLEALKWALPHMAAVPLPVDGQVLRDRFAKRLLEAEALIAKAEEASRA